MLNSTSGHVSYAQDSWISHLSEGWNLVFKQGKLNPLGTVVEVAPGDVPKIGAALAEYGFQGSLYVVEPEPKALQKITSLYRMLMQGATIIPLPYLLEDVIPFLPESPFRIDAILANHPLDDMIVGEILQNEQVGDFFENCYENTAECAARVWDHIETNWPQVQAAKWEIAQQWKALIKHTNPRIVGISQYRSGFYASHCIHAPDEHAHELLCLLQREMGETPRFFRDKISALGLEGERWWVRFESGL